MKAIDYISETAPFREVLFNKLQGMKTRCNQPSCTEYKNYGGRGIKICDEWNDSKYGFLAFYHWSMTHGYREGLTIDRIDVNGDYEPNNCRYITLTEQQYNKQDTVWIWQGKPIQLIKCYEGEEYKILRAKIKEREISPMTLKPYPKYNIDNTRYIIVEKAGLLFMYCQRKELDYSTIYHIINIAMPTVKVIKEKELNQLITYFYYSPLLH